MNMMGFTRKSKMRTLGETLLWGGIALGAGMWLMKECRGQMPFCHCSTSHGENGSHCENHSHS